MADMVEKVAMALCQKAIEPKQCPCAETGEFACKGSHPEAMARAAIRALMEPDEKMLETAGAMEGFNVDDSTIDADCAHIEWWQAMLKAALDD